eukprot:5658281-Lingulodinium_polyedra.AAC.1
MGTSREAGLLTRANVSGPRWCPCLLGSAWDGFDVCFRFAVAFCKTRGTARGVCMWQFVHPRLLKAGYHAGLHSSVCTPGC